MGVRWKKSKAMPKRVGEIMECEKCGCKNKCEAQREITVKIMDQNVDLIHLNANLKSTIAEKDQTISKLMGQINDL